MIQTDTILYGDRRTRAALYARANIPEYWIVNLVSRAIEVHRLPTREGYADRIVVGSG